MSAAIIPAFVAERRSHPWPADPPRVDGVGYLRDLGEDGEAPAAALYEAYLDVPGDRHERLSHTEFGEAIVAAGIERTRGADGRLYHGITVETRAQRARAACEAYLSEQVWAVHKSDPWRADLTRHRLEKHALTGEWECAHTMPPDVLAGYAAIDADVAALVADGALDELMEKHYGPFLRWQAGDQDPNIAIRALQREADIVRLQRELAVAEAALEACYETRTLTADEPSMLTVMTAAIRGDRVRPKGETYAQRFIIAPSYTFELAQRAVRDVQGRLAQVTAASEESRAALLAAIDQVIGDADDW